MIPKIIHYCWLSKEPVPDKLKKYMDTWKEILPDYEFVKWDFDRFDKKSSLWVEQAFDNKKYAFAADYIRLYALYNYGGIYMDMDIELLKSFDNLLDSKYMMAFEKEGTTYIEAGCMGAEKHSEFIKDVLGYYDDRPFVKENGEFDTLPLPQIMSKVFGNGEYNISFMDWHAFTNKSYATGIESPIGRSYAIHHFAGSWKTKKEIQFQRIKQILQKKYGKKITANKLFRLCECTYCYGFAYAINKIKTIIKK